MTSLNLEHFFNLIRICQYLGKLAVTQQVGHINTETIKGLCLLGQQDAYIIHAPHGKAAPSFWDFISFWEFICTRNVKQLIQCLMLPINYAITKIYDMFIKSLPLGLKCLQMYLMHQLTAVHPALKKNPNQFQWFQNREMVKFLQHPVLVSYTAN